MRISDWSSDVCSSDLLAHAVNGIDANARGERSHTDIVGVEPIGEILAENRQRPRLVGTTQGQARIQQNKAFLRTERKIVVERRVIIDRKSTRLNSSH